MRKLLVLSCDGWPSCPFNRDGRNCTLVRHHIEGAGAEFNVPDDCPLWEHEIHVTLPDGYFDRRKEKKTQ
ncbi:hypothetical protein LCGC14_1506520 [marine sediment metagenome]|uniref:Uncharacterized protein n=1 Tax=marine sediment metagenome TaxID=412755 RepID=A0A0F9JNC6_9ZZZZ